LGGFKITSSGSLIYNLDVFVEQFLGAFFEEGSGRSSA
jgi:hypothetical protein